MAEIVCSVVADEAARKFSSLLSGEDGDRESHEDKVERLEMAVLKLQTVLAVSEDYLPPTHRPLIRWKAKLKRVAKEGKGVLHHQKKQVLKSKRSSSSIWRGISRAAKLFVPFFYGTEELSVATVKRFERFADHASDFIKFVEHGGRCPTRNLLVSSLPSLTRSLGAGEAVERSLRIRSGTAVLLLQPWWLEEQHDEEGNTKIAFLWMSYDHDVLWEKSLKMMAAFYLSDSVDVMKIATDCVDLLPSQFCTARAAMKELLADIALHGRNSPAPSPLYLRFVRGIQDSHRYGFEPNPQLRCSGGRVQALDPILLACAHFYIMPAEKSNCAAVLELAWHASPSYLPKKLSEHHEVFGIQQMDEDVFPKVANGFLGEEGAFSHDDERQWWCPQSSTRLLVAPLLSPPRTLPQWCQRQKQEQSTKQAEMIG